MSHEFRTPLNAILGFAELLIREDGLTAERCPRYPHYAGGGPSVAAG